MKRTGKIFRNIFVGLILIIALAIVGIYVSGNGYVVTAFEKTYLKGHKTAHIDDHGDFKNAVIRAGTPQPWQLHENYNRLKLTETLRKELEDFQTIGFGIFKDGQLLY